MARIIFAARFLFVAVVLLACVPSLYAREWTDSTGKYHQEADLVDFDGHLVVLRKAEGRLVAVPLSSLSAADQQYLKSNEAKQEMASAVSKDRTWTLIDGTKLPGQVERFGQKDVVFSRKYSKLYVNGRLFKDLPEYSQQMALQLVSHEEGRQYNSDDAVQFLIATRKGVDLVYHVQGVLILTPDGRHVGVPIWMLSERDRAVLLPEWNAWLAAEKDRELKEQHQEEESTMARAAANEYQRNQRIQTELQYLQVASQWFDLWQVNLIAPDGTVSTVTVPARDSYTAQVEAQKQCPNCTVGATQRLSRRNY